ncbi:MAG TPA: OB-fold nucleic acid binding domain-containing protein, partial [Rubrobacter sp.]
MTELPGIGPRVEAALGDLGIASLADMVSHYPSRHEDLSNVKRISDLRVGERATIFGTVVSTRPVGKPVRGRAPGFSAQLYDGTGYIPATVWGRSWLLNQLLPDVRVVVSGEVQSRYGIQLAAKNIEVVEDPAGEDGPHAGRFVPVYPVNKYIQTRRMRTLIHRALDAADRILDPLPA